MTVEWCGRCAGGLIHSVAVVERTIILARGVIGLPGIVQVEFRDSVPQHWWGSTVLSQQHCGRVLLNSKSGLRELPLIVCHELIHVHQIHSRRLVPATGGVLWCGTHYSGIDGYSWEEYRSAPWEVEARRMETGLLASVLDRGAKNA